MKTLLTLFVLFFSSNVIAEIYSCSHELSRFDRPGEVETKTYKRIGKIFKHNRGWEFKIIDETEEVLMLINYFSLGHIIQQTIPDAHSPYLKV